MPYLSFYTSHMATLGFKHQLACSYFNTFTQDAAQMLYLSTFKPPMVRSYCHLPSVNFMVPIPFQHDLVFSIPNIMILSQMNPYSWLGFLPIFHILDGMFFHVSSSVSAAGPVSCKKFDRLQFLSPIQKRAITSMFAHLPLLQLYLHIIIPSH